MIRPNSIEKDVEEFLSANNLLDKRLMLAFSGGVDSLCLFHALLAVKQKRGIDFFVLHVDHRWRKNSDKEAISIKSYVESFGVECEVATLENLQGSNKECLARNRRHIAYKNAMKEKKGDAVLLAHHADDQAETILKRVVEGASIRALSGIKKCSTITEMQVFRPLMGAEKKELAAYCEKKKLNVVEDFTNFDRSNLRSRIRQDVFPAISQAFGKNPVKGLLRLGFEMSLFDDHSSYLEKKYRDQFHKSSLGSWMDLSKVHAETYFEWYTLVQVFFQLSGSSFSFAQLKTIAEKCLTKAPACQFSSGNKLLIVDRRQLFMPSQVQQEWKLLEVPPCRFTDFFNSDTKQDWRKTWEGANFVRLERVETGGYELKTVPLSSKVKARGKITTLEKWLSQHKVPTFLRKLWPVVTLNDEVVHEFWTGEALDKKPSKLPSKDVIPNQDAVFFQFVANGVEQ